MLYNRNWDKPKHKRGTWGSMIEWLETKDPNGSYNYCDVDDCLHAQYCRSIGRRYGLFRALFSPRMEIMASKYPWTFGAALERAKARQ